MEHINKNIELLKKRLAALDLQASYELASKIKYEIVSLGNELSLVSPELAPKYNLFSKVEGYLDDTIVCLEIGEEIPHMKAELSITGHEYWLNLIHTAVYKLSEKESVPKYEKAFVGIYTGMPKGYNNTRVWDTSNRAINLVLNNLKGIFFPDDDIEHMAFSVVGGWSREPKTVIYIGDLSLQSVLIMQKLILVKDENMIF